MENAVRVMLDNTHISTTKARIRTLAGQPAGLVLGTGMLLVMAIVIWTFAYGPLASATLDIVVPRGCVLTVLRAGTEADMYQGTQPPPRGDVILTVPAGEYSLGCNTDILQSGLHVQAGVTVNVNLYLYPVSQPHPSCAGRSAC